MVTKSQEFQDSREILRNSGEKFLGISSKFLETESQTCDPTKICHLRDQFWEIFREFPRNQLQERILEKFLRNSSKKVTMVGDSAEITHFYYLGTYTKCTFNLQLMAPSDLQKVYIRPTKSVHSTYENCKSDLQKVYIRPKTIKVYNISELKKGISLPSKSTCSCSTC